MRRRVTHLRVIPGGKQEAAARDQLHPTGQRRDVLNVIPIRPRAFGRIRVFNDDGTSTVYETDPTRPAA